MFPLPQPESPVLIENASAHRVTMRSIDLRLKKKAVMNRGPAKAMNNPRPFWMGSKDANVLGTLV